MILNYLSTVFSVLAALVSPLNPSTKPSIFAENSVSSTMFFTPVVYFSVGIRSLKSLLTAFLNRVSIFGFCKVKATLLFSYISVLANRTMNRLPNSAISACSCNFLLHSFLLSLKMAWWMKETLLTVRHNKSDQKKLWDILLGETGDRTINSARYIAFTITILR